MLSYVKLCLVVFALQRLPPCNLKTNHETHTNTRHAIMQCWAYVIPFISCWINVSIAHVCVRVCVCGLADRWSACVHRWLRGTLMHMILCWGTWSLPSSPDLCASCPSLTTPWTSAWGWSFMAVNGWVGEEDYLTRVLHTAFWRQQWPLLKKCFTS